MRIFVNRVGEERRGVAFRCDAGVGMARWMGSELPIQGSTAYVELNVPDPVVEWQRVAPTVRYDIDVDEDGCLWIRGEVLTVGGPGDPVVTLRVGTDVVMIEVGTGRETLVVGERIAFTTLALEVYPYDV
ncbi:hypothetical protein [Streptomyces sp. NPDC091371]|uniref:hypothetical protein n=1 Tax=Streptomyces sp. NPDC091371 TaxID=3155303 RepID=UPI003448D935